MSEAEPISTAYRAPVFPGGTGLDMSLDEVLARLPSNHRAVVQVGLLRRQIECLNEENLRLRTEGSAE